MRIQPLQNECLHMQRSKPLTCKEGVNVLVRRRFADLEPTVIESSLVVMLLDQGSDVHH